MNDGRAAAQSPSARLALGTAHEIGVVVVTHGQLATELVNAAEMIVGDLPQFTAVSIGWHDDVDHAREEIGQAIERVRRSAGGTEQSRDVLMLTDMFGGTPANLGMTFLETNTSRSSPASICRC